MHGAVRYAINAVTITKLELLRTNGARQKGLRAGPRLPMKFLSVCLSVQKIKPLFLARFRPQTLIAA